MGLLLHFLWHNVGWCKMYDCACRNYHHHIVNTVDRLISAIKQRGSEAAINIADIAQVCHVPQSLLNLPTRSSSSAVSAALLRCGPLVAGAHPCSVYCK